MITSRASNGFKRDAIDGGTVLGKGPLAELAAITEKKPVDYGDHVLDTMFNLPGFEGLGEVVISKQIIEGTAPPLYIYADCANRGGNTVASA